MKRSGVFVSGIRLSDRYKLPLVWDMKQKRAGAALLLGKYGEGTHIYVHYQLTNALGFLEDK
ncbi:hypothetical protein KCP73_01675 [Salmonella enterica subsp. enterica]|nr:hypothetical protein KCP73_01675 [Salmonella enterica subsp. enterica]